jgi:hypothetical protein
MRRFVVLGANERKTLREIGRQFIDDDPEFRRSFDDIGRRSPYSLRWAYPMPRYVRRDLARTASPPGRPAVAGSSHSRVSGTPGGRSDDPSHRVSRRH